MSGLPTLAQLTRPPGLPEEDTRWSFADLTGTGNGADPPAGATVTFPEWAGQVRDEHVALEAADTQAAADLAAETAARQAADAAEAVARNAAIDAAIAAVINGAPGALNTLDELAQALGDDPNLAATLTGLIATKQPASVELDALAGLGGGDLGYLERTAAGVLVARTSAQVKAALALTKGDVGLGNVPNVDATARANHTGTQPLASISDLPALSAAGQGWIRDAAGLIVNRPGRVLAELHATGTYTDTVAAAPADVFSFAIPADFATGDVIEVDLEANYLQNSGVARTMTLATLLAATTSLSGTSPNIGSGANERSLAVKFWLGCDVVNIPPVATFWREGTLGGLSIGTTDTLKFGQGLDLEGARTWSVVNDQRGQTWKLRYNSSGTGTVLTVVRATAKLFTKPL